MKYNCFLLVLFLVFALTASSQQDSLPEVKPLSFSIDSLPSAIFAPTDSLEKVNIKVYFPMQSGYSYEPVHFDFSAFLQIPEASEKPKKVIQKVKLPSKPKKIPESKLPVKKSIRQRNETSSIWLYLIPAGGFAIVLLSLYLFKNRKK